MSIVSKILSRVFLQGPESSHRRTLSASELDPPNERRARLAFLRTQTRSLIEARRIEQLALPVLNNRKLKGWQAGSSVQTEPRAETRVRIIDDSPQLPEWDLRRHI